MKLLPIYLATSLAIISPLNAKDDTPTPHLLKEAATALKSDANQLAKQFQAASIGKQWGRSPGHQALYRAILAYRNELNTTEKMCKPAESPDRLLKVILDSRSLGEHMEFLTQFVLISDDIRKAIIKTSQTSRSLLGHVQKYETRYFVWKKIELEREHAKDLNLLRQQIAALQQSHNQVVNQSNEILTTIEDGQNSPTIIVQPIQPQICPPPSNSRPIQRPVCRPTKPTRPTATTSPAAQPIRPQPIRPQPMKPSPVRPPRR